MSEVAKDILIGVSSILGFLAIFAWFVPDVPARKAMAWIVTRKNFSLVSMPIGGSMLLVVLVIIIIAIVKVWNQLHFAPWVTPIAVIGAAVLTLGMVMLIIDNIIKSVKSRRNP